MNSLLELRIHASDDNAHIVMAPGEYWISKNGGDRTFVRLTGDNTVYDLSQATFKVDTRDFDGFGGGHSNTVNVVGLYGAGSTLTGLDLEAVDVDLGSDPNAQRWADAPATNMIRISGADNRLEDSSIVARGSNTYGYGDAFGKGGPPCSGCANIPPHKGLGVQVLGASGTTEIDSLDLHMRAFGHGIYIQETTGLVDIRNTAVVGELADSHDVIGHPVYQATITSEHPNGRTHYGPAMWDGINISKSEDGIRTYGTTTADLYIENTVVANMREAYSLFSTTGSATVVNASAWDNETGFEPGAGDVILGSRASATNGPVLYMRQDDVDDTRIEIELHGDNPQPGRDWNVAVISGERNKVTLTKGEIAPGALSLDSMVRVSQRYNDWRHLPGLPDDSIENGRVTRDLSIINTTGQNLMLGAPSLEGSNDYEIADGATLGGARFVFTAQTSPDVDIRVEAGGRIDPVGTLVVSPGSGDLELSPGVAGSTTGSLLFHLADEATSDKVQVNLLARLNIGEGELGFEDFLFTTDETFAGGTFTLFQTSKPIFGSLSGALTGTVGSLAAELMMAPDQRRIQLVVEAPAILAGDYNCDGNVDAADYVVWRDGLGRQGFQLPADGDGDGQVGSGDYGIWRDNYDALRDGVASASVPEPAAPLPWLVALWRPRRQSERRETQ